MFRKCKIESQRDFRQKFVTKGKSLVSLGSEEADCLFKVANFPADVVYWQSTMLSPQEHIFYVLLYSLKFEDNDVTPRNSYIRAWKACRNSHKNRCMGWPGGAPRTFWDPLYIQSTPQSSAKNGTPPKLHTVSTRSNVPFLWQRSPIPAKFWCTPVLLSPCKFEKILITLWNSEKLVKNRKIFMEIGSIQLFIFCWFKIRLFLTLFCVGTKCQKENKPFGETKSEALALLFHRVHYNEAQWCTDNNVQSKVSSWMISLTRKFAEILTKIKDQVEIYTWQRNKTVGLCSSTDFCIWSKLSVWPGGTSRFTHLAVQEIVCQKK